MPLSSSFKFLSHDDEIIRWPRTAELKSQAGLSILIRKLEERLANLSGGVAVINIGAATEAELKEKKARVEDALPRIGATNERCPGMPR